MKYKRNMISKVIMSKKICCLCFSSQKIVSYHVDDLVVLDDDASKDWDSEEVAISQILGLVLDDSYMVTQLDFICVECLKEALASYRFIKKCKENLRLFQKSVETLEHCFNNLIDYTDNIKTIITTINTDCFENIQHYNVQSMKDAKTALKHFKTVTRQIPKMRKQRECNQDVLDVCSVIREENLPTKYKCKICPYDSKKAFNVKKHFYSQHGAKLFQCMLCKRRYGSDSLLKQHVNESHSNTMCSECGKVYKNRYSLLYHMRLHSGELPYECKHCGVRFRLSSRRAEHVRRFHMEPSVECNVCHVKFKSLGSLYSHRKRHGDPNSRLHVASDNIGLEAGIENEVCVEQE